MTLRGLTAMLYPLSFKIRGCRGARFVLPGFQNPLGLYIIFVFNIFICIFNPDARGSGTEEKAKGNTPFKEAEALPREISFFRPGVIKDSQAVNRTNPNPDTQYPHTLKDEKEEGYTRTDKVLLRCLDKITARVSDIEAPLGQSIKFGNLEITARLCQKAPPEDPPESIAFLEITENKPDENASHVFSGWMFASSPAHSAMEHPVYDIWVKECMGNALPDAAALDSSSHISTPESSPFKASVSSSSIEALRRGFASESFQKKEGEATSVPEFRKE
ncbi:MAG: DUF2155 domain-containing protein [Caedimonas sp.]|nr:DUF2155 domain-containing protein [Caedimonas sp.]